MFYNATITFHVYHNNSLNCILGGSSCKPYFCSIFCFLHKLHMQYMQIYKVLVHCTCKSCREQKILQKLGVQEAPPNDMWLTF